MSPPPLLITKACRSYRRKLWRVKDAFYPAATPAERKQLAIPKPKYRRPSPRGKVARMMNGAEFMVETLLHRALRCPALKAACDAKPIPYIIDNRGVRRPAWTTYASSPVGHESRIWKGLTRADKARRMPDTVDHLVHVVLWHQFLPVEGTGVDDIWYSLWRLSKRYADFESRIAFYFYGGFAMWEVDRSIQKGIPGVMVHMHAVFGLKGRKTLPTAVKRCWTTSAEDNEIGKLSQHKIPLSRFDQVLQYIAGSRSVDCQRFAKILDGMIYVRASIDTPYEHERRRQWRAKGYTSYKQLHLMLAGLRCYMEQPRWRGAWSFRTWKGRKLKGRLAGIP